MNMFFKIISVLILFWPSQTLAHAKITTTPANDAIVETIVEQIQLDFSKPTRLIKLNMQDGNEVKISNEFLPSSGFHKQFFTSFKKLKQGKYIVKWRALSKDGHPIKGDFKFTVK